MIGRSKGATVTAQTPRKGRQLERRTPRRYNFKVHLRIQEGVWYAVSQGRDRWSKLLKEGFWEDFTREAEAIMHGDGAGLLKTIEPKGPFSSVGTPHRVPGFSQRRSEIEERPELLPYSHYLRQAWTELGLSGVLCVEGRPARLPFRIPRNFTPDQKRERHRFVWNQGLVPLLVFLTAEPGRGSQSNRKDARKRSHLATDFSMTMSPA